MQLACRITALLWGCGAVLVLGERQSPLSSDRSTDRFRSQRSIVSQKTDMMFAHHDETTFHSGLVASSAPLLQLSTGTKEARDIAMWILIGASAIVILMVCSWWQNKDKL